MHIRSTKEVWQKQYLASSEALARIAVQELAALTDEEALRRIRTLVTPGIPWRDRPDWSGLVEQQALF